jgi:hypothetical protein
MKVNELWSGVHRNLNIYCNVIRENLNLSAGFERCCVEFEHHSPFNHRNYAFFRLA